MCHWNVQNVCNVSSEGSRLVRLWGDRHHSSDVGLRDGVPANRFTTPIWDCSHIVPLRSVVIGHVDFGIMCLVGVSSRADPMWKPITFARIPDRPHTLLRNIVEIARLTISRSQKSPTPPECSSSHNQVCFYMVYLSHAYYTERRLQVNGHTLERCLHAPSPLVLHLPPPLFLLPFLLPLIPSPKPLPPSLLRM